MSIHSSVPNISHHTFTQYTRTSEHFTLNSGVDWTDVFSGIFGVLHIAEGNINIGRWCRRRRGRVREMNSRKIGSTNRKQPESREMGNVMRKKSNRILIFFSIHAGDHIRIANVIPSAVNKFRKEMFPLSENTLHFFYGCENCRYRRCGEVCACISLWIIFVCLSTRCGSPTDVIKWDTYVKLNWIDLNAGCFISHTVAACCVPCDSDQLVSLRQFKIFKSMCRCDDSFTTLLSYALFIAIFCGFCCILHRDQNVTVTLQKCPIMKSLKSGGERGRERNFLLLPLHNKKYASNEQSN